MRPGYTCLGAFLVEYAETQCEELLNVGQRARIVDQILIAISSDIQPMSEEVIDSFIQHEIVNGCSGAGHR